MQPLDRAPQMCMTLFFLALFGALVVSPGGGWAGEIQHWESLKNEAIATFRQGNHKRGIQLAEEALKYARRQFGEDDPDTRFSVKLLVAFHASKTRVVALLPEIDEDIRASRLSKPKGNNALHKIAEILQMDPENAEALKALRRVAEKYVSLAQAAQNKGDRATANKYLDQAKKLVPDLPSIQALSK